MDGIDDGLLVGVGIDGMELDELLLVDAQPVTNSHKTEITSVG